MKVKPKKKKNARVPVNSSNSVNSPKAVVPSLF